MSPLKDAANELAEHARELEGFLCYPGLLPEKMRESVVAGKAKDVRLAVGALLALLDPAIRAEDNLKHAAAQAFEALPDYPWKPEPTACECVWALATALSGTKDAADDLHKELVARQQEIARLNRLVRAAYVDGFKTGAHSWREAEAESYFETSVAARDMELNRAHDDIHHEGG